MNVSHATRPSRTAAPARALLLLPLATLLLGASNLAPNPGPPSPPPSPVEETFKRALFDEEGRRDYPAALRGYEEVVHALDDQRRLAATAVFRLGECFRKLGRTNEAIAQYQRILRDFAAEETLATLSRQNLAGLGLGLGPGPSPAAAQGASLALMPPGSPPAPTQAAPAAATSAEAEEIRRIQSVVANSPDLVNAPANGTTPLAAAATKGQLAVVTYLLDHGADPASLASKEGSALFYAAGAGHKAIVELLLARGTPVNAAAASGTTPLHLAAGSGFRAIVDVLLAQGADPNLIGFLDQPTPRSPLGAAVLGRHPVVARLLLEKGAQPNAGAPDIAPALAHAATPEMVRLLLAHRADPNADGGRRLLLAVNANDLATATLLLEAGADPNLGFGTDSPQGAGTPLHRPGDAPQQSGVVIRAPSRILKAGDKTPLHAAIAAGRHEMAELLLKHGADINRPGSDALAPIHWAAQVEGTNALAWVLAHGGNPNLRGANQTIPLEWTGITRLNSPIPAGDPGNAEANPWRRALLLLAGGANPDLPFSNGNTVLHAAARSGNPGVFAALAGRVTNLNATLADGRTPLILAAAHGNEAAVAWLLKAGAKVDAVDADDATALLHATVRGDENNVRRLLEAGANPTTPSEIGFSPLSFVRQERSPAGLRGDGTYDLRIMNSIRPNERPRYKRILDLLAAHAGTNDVATPAPARPQPRNQIAFFGAVQGTQELPPGRPLTLTDAILSQKLPSSANLTRVRVHRHPETLATGEPAILDIDVAELLSTNDRSKDVVLRPGDRIEVKERTL